MHTIIHIQDYSYNNYTSTFFKCINTTSINCKTTQLCNQRLRMSIIKLHPNCITYTKLSYTLCVLTRTAVCFKLYNCSYDRGFFLFLVKIFCAQNLKNCHMDFQKICSASTSNILDVQCKFMFKSDSKILSYGRFKILAQACPG